MIRLLVLFCLFLSASAVPAAERIKDIADFSALRSNQLTGYGIVVGLNGTGDDSLEYTVQSVKSAMSRFGLSLPEGVNPGLKNSAVVMLTATLPPFSKKGQKIDVTVASLGKAKSLRGGSLLLAPLLGADGDIYALAQGSLVIGGMGAEGQDGSKLTINVPSSGRIPEGATVEQTVANNLAYDSYLTLNLRDPDVTTATRIAAVINDKIAADMAKAIDPVSIQVIAVGTAAERMLMMSRIENLEIESAITPARVVINARTGTVVISGRVRVLPAAISHGKLTVRITETLRPSQPAPLSRGETVVVPQSDLKIEQEPGRMFLLDAGADLKDLVKAINQLGVAPGDLVAILEALKQAGALKAELVVI
jgi:flagellar P-ring protein precursor FlgI